MYEEDSLSSGYLVANGSRVRTAFHAVSDWSRRHLNAGQGSTASAPVPVFIYDSSGKLLSSPDMDKATAIFPRSNLDTSGVGRQITLPNNDLVEIQLDRVIGPPLPATSTMPKAGEPIYVIGYPQRTADRKAFGVPDSPGGQLRVSEGRAIPIEVMARKEGLDPKDLTDETKREVRQMLVSNADGAPGDSGGATVNALGQVIGTYTAGYPADGSATPNHLSYSSNDTVLNFRFNK